MKTLCFNFIAASVLLLSPLSLYAWQQDEGTQNDVSGNTPDLPTNPAPEISAPSGIRGADGFGDGGVVGGEGFANVRQVATNAVMITWSEKNDELQGFSIKLGDWEVISIEPQKRIIPIVGGTVAAVRVGDSIAAFSGEKAWWDVIELSKGSKAVPVAYPSYLQIEDNGHLYTFAAEKGAWTSPTDPELQQATETMNLRFENPGKASHFSVVEPRMKAFEKWRDSQPKYKARGIYLAIHSGNGQGTAELRTARQSWMTELKAKMHEVFDVSDAASASGTGVDAPTQSRTVADLEEQIETLQVELNALRSGKPETSDAATKQPDRATLRKQVEKTFDVRQQLQELEAQKLRLKLQLVEANLTTRLKNRDGIIQRRVEELLDPRGDTTKWSPAEGLKQATDAKPVTGSPIGMPGPQNFPEGNSDSDSEVSGLPMGTGPATSQNAIAAMKWPQPSEVVTSLRDCRDQMVTEVERIRKQQKEVDEYSRPLTELIADGIAPKNANERWYDAVQKSSKDNLDSFEKLRRDRDRDWHQAWSTYTTHIRLLRLDVEAAESILSPLEQKHARLKPLTESGAIPVREFRQLESELRLAKIQHRRAEELLQLYTGIEKNEPQLNPDYKAPAADEGTGVKSE